MKRALFSSLLLIALLLLVACGGSPAAPTAVAEVAPTAAPTDPPPTPTPEPSPTAEPTATAAPTATPAPTEPTCDMERLREAAENITLFESYALSLSGYVQLPGEQVRQPMLLVDSTVALTGGEVSALEMTFDSVDEAEPFQLIVVDGLLYFRAGGEPWQLATELVGELMGSQLNSGQTLDVNVLEVLIDFPCAAFSERVDGRDAAGYHFTDIDVLELAAVNASAAEITELEAESIQAVEFLIWVAEVEDAPVVVKWAFNVTFDVDGEEARVETTALVSEFNEPVDIRAPEGVVAVAFPLALPRPDDAEVYLEDATTLAFFTAATPEEMETLYVDALIADGWTAGETDTQTMEGRKVELRRFSRDAEELELAIAVTETNTLVAFTLSEEE